MLTYTPEKSYAAYGELVIRLDSYDDVMPMLRKVSAELDAKHPDIEYKLKRIELGPSSGSKIEARLVGPDPTILRGLAQQTLDIMRADPGAFNVRHDWRERTKVLEPIFNESQARRYGITKSDVDDLLQMAFSGLSVGIYRDGTNLMPIVARLPDEERVDVSTIEGMKIWSPATQGYVPPAASHARRECKVGRSVGCA